MEKYLCADNHLFDMIVGIRFNITFLGSQFNIWNLTAYTIISCPSGDVSFYLKKKERKKTARVLLSLHGYNIIQHVRNYYGGAGCGFFFVSFVCFFVYFCFFSCLYTRTPVNIRLTVWKGMSPGGPPSLLVAAPSIRTDNNDNNDNIPSVASIGRSHFTRRRRALCPGESGDYCPTRRRVSAIVWASHETRRRFSRDGRRRRRRRRGTAAVSRQNLISFKRSHFAREIDEYTIIVRTRSVPVPKYNSAIILWLYNMWTTFF